MPRKTIFRQRRDGWWYTVETDMTVHEDGPFETKQAAQDAAPRSSKPIIISNEDRQNPAVLIEKYRSLFNRVDANDLELATAVREMSNAGISQQQMALSFSPRKQTWFSFMYRLSMIPESLIRYLRADIIKTSVLVRGVDKLGVVTMERTIPHILKIHRQQGISGRITAKELYENAVQLWNIAV
jgi:hypothetical protein